MLRLVALFCLSVPLLKAEQRCQLQGGIRVYNGKNCATTTRYDDGQRGACGCGPPNSNTPFDWNLSELVVAASGKYFDNGGDKSWCGQNCGKCVRLCPTGGFVPGEGRAPSSSECHVFMVTNDCPIQGNEKWCGQGARPGSGQGNTFGYEVHFDVQNRRQQAERLGWDNVEVTWEEIGCPSDLASLYSQCECH